MKPQILILDDFKVSNEIMSDLLGKLGYKTFSCQRSLEAIEILKDTKIDAIVTDYYMPGTNGIEFLKEVRQLPGYQCIPIIFLSAADHPDALREDSEYKISAWFKKPVDINLLSKTIRKALAK